MNACISIRMGMHDLDATNRETGGVAWPRLACIRMCEGVHFRNHVHSETASNGAYLRPLTLTMIDTQIEVCFAGLKITYDYN